MKYLYYSMYVVLDRKDHYNFIFFNSKKTLIQQAFAAFFTEGCEFFCPQSDPEWRSLRYTL